MAVEAAEGLDDGLVTAEHAVDDEPDAVALVMDDDDLLDLGHLAADLEEVAQADLGDELAADGDEVAAVAGSALDGLDLDVLGDGRHGHDELVVADLDELAFDDG